jgi:hypothetical protein
MGNLRAGEIWNICNVISLMPKFIETTKNNMDKITLKMIIAFFILGEKRSTKNVTDICIPLL